MTKLIELETYDMAVVEPPRTRDRPGTCGAAAVDFLDAKGQETPQ